MIKKYYEPENIAALADVFREVQQQLKSHGLDTPERLEHMGERVFLLAGEGVSPTKILSVILSEIAALAEKRSS